MLIGLQRVVLGHRVVPGEQEQAYSFLVYSGFTETLDYRAIPLSDCDSGSGGKWNKQRPVVLSQGEAVSIAAGTPISFQTPELCCITLGEGRGSRVSVV